MAEPSHSTGAGHGTSTAGPPTYPGMPLWVKVSGIVALLLVLLVVGIMVAAGGQHGPMRHLPASAPGAASGVPHA